VTRGWRSGFGRSGRWIAVGAAAVLAASTVTGPVAADPLVADSPGELLVGRATTSQPCGTVILPGSSWLGGGGADVKSNGATQGGRSCGTLSVADRSVQNGYGWQCVELAARLYHAKGWGIVYAGGNGGARYIPEGSPNLQFQPNGSGYTPVPGDLVVEAFGTYGHVTVVDRVEGAVIHAVEQNAAWTGRKTYTWTAGTAGGAYNGGVVRGFMHAPLNTARSGSGGSTTNKVSNRPASVRGKVVRRKLVLRWNSPGQAVTGYRIQLKRHDVNGGRWSPGVTVPSTSDKFRIGITPGKIYRLRVAGLNAAGLGPWAKTATLRP